MQARALLLALLVAFVGCGDPTGPDEVTLDGIRVNHTDPAALVDAHLEALASRSAAAYVAMLEKPASTARGTTGFRYRIREGDADLVPWAAGGTWDYEAEVAILENMTDPAFAGEELPVETIHVQSVPVSEGPAGDGVLHTVDAVVQVLLGPDAGWIASSRLAIEMHPDESGFLRIREIVETEPPGRAAPSVEPASLGGVKARYRWHDLADVTIDGIRVNHEHLADLVEAHFQALSRRSFAAYKATLKPDFRFYIRSDDADLFPWMTGDSWDRAVELEIIANMTDDDFSGEELPVQSIEAAYQLLTEQPVPEGTRIALDVTVAILVGPDTGWIARTRLEFLVCLDSGGFWRIAEIREFDLLRSVDESSFGQIKGLYR